MFEVDLLREINRYKEGKVSYEEFRNFVIQNSKAVNSVLESNSVLDSETKELIKGVLDEKKEDSAFFLEMYKRWREIYESKGICEESWNVINKILLRYYPYNVNRVLRVTEVDGDSVFDSFVDNILNGLRIFFSNDLEYFLNNVYKQMKWFDRIKVRFKVKKVIRKIARYEFDGEVIQFVKWIRQQKKNLIH